MTCLFIDGFDGYAAVADLTQKWDATYSTNNSYYTFGSPGRFGGESVALKSHSNVYIQKNVDQKVTIITGAAIYLGNSISTYLIEAMDDSNVQVCVHIDNAGVLTVRRNTNIILGTSGQSLPFFEWAYIEFKATINDTTGSYELRINGDTWISATGVDTQNTTNAYISSMRYMGGGNVTYWDDLYICDTLGTTNNDFLGECAIETLYPTADNAVAFSRSGGTTNYENVDESYADDDTTYTYSATLNAEDLFDYGNMTATNAGTVFCVSPNIMCRKETAGGRKIAARAKSGANNTTGSSQTVAANYRARLEPLEEKPGGGAWTKSDVDAAQFGYKITV